MSTTVKPYNVIDTTVIDEILHRHTKKEKTTLYNNQFFNQMLKENFSLQTIKEYNTYRLLIKTSQHAIAILYQIAQHVDHITCRNFLEITKRYKFKFNPKILKLAKKPLLSNEEITANCLLQFKNIFKLTISDGNPIIEKSVKLMDEIITNNPTKTFIKDILCFSLLSYIINVENVGQWEVSRIIGKMFYKPTSIINYRRFLQPYLKNLYVLRKRFVNFIGCDNS